MITSYFQKGGVKMDDYHRTEDRIEYSLKHDQTPYRTLTFIILDYVGGKWEEWSQISGEVKWTKEKSLSPIGEAVIQGRSVDDAVKEVSYPKITTLTTRTGKPLERIAANF